MEHMNGMDYMDGVDKLDEMDVHNTTETPKYYYRIHLRAHIRNMDGNETATKENIKDIKDPIGTYISFIHINNCKSQFPVWNRTCGRTTAKRFILHDKNR